MVEVLRTYPLAITTDTPEGRKWQSWLPNVVFRQHFRTEKKLNYCGNYVFLGLAALSWAILLDFRGLLSDSTYWKVPDSSTLTAQVHSEFGAIAKGAGEGAI